MKSCPCTMCPLPASSPEICLKDAQEPGGEPVIDKCKTSMGQERGCGGGDEFVSAKG